MTITFDTLKFVKTLESAGMPVAQAEAVSVAVRDAQNTSNVVTKGHSEKPERKAGATDRDGLQGANRSNSRSYCEDLQRSRPPESVDARDAVGYSECPKQDWHDMEAETDSKFDSLRSDFDSLRRDFDLLRNDLALLRKDMVLMGRDITIKLGSMVIGAGVVLIAAMGVLAAFIKG